MTESQIVLFHRIADHDSARVRKLIVDRGLSAKIDFRNVGTGTRDIALLNQIAKNDITPALLLADGRLLQNVNEILAFLLTC